ncbi:MAG: M15 family metallopeptidase [Bacilli bacterium]|nr:M15 family metallopeptidase [Bacilli bacterium]MDD3895556.1 M15 family metallopeptidase [Bacilli bacterium]MDD4407539.1 M15 family metallopeptidase [Bacilli bacterium]
MCLDENTLEIFNNIFILLSIILPLLFIIFLFYDKKRKKKFGYYLLSLIIIILIIYFRGEIMNINICESDKKINNTTTTKAVPAINSDNYVGKTSKGYTIEKKDGVYFIDGYLIVNKSYALSEDFIPENTHLKISDELCISCIDKEAYKKWLIMKNDAAAIGLNIHISSGYRSFGYQKDIYNGYVTKDGKDIADTYSARAGHSEHQSSLAFDLNSIDSSFIATNEGRWVNENAYLYGFIIRYPKGKEKITGYKYEPWHLRYVGLNLAKKLYNDGKWITMEEYFGIDSKYK